MDTWTKRHPLRAVVLLLFCGGLLATTTIAARAMPSRSVPPTATHLLLGRYPIRSLTGSDGVASGDLLYTSPQLRAIRVARGTSTRR